MKNRILSVFAFFIGFASSAQNLIVNGDFSDGLNSWTTFLADWEGVTATIAEVNNEASITNISGAGGQVWWVQLNQVLTPAQIGELNIGAEYTVTFEARSNVAGRQLSMYFGEDGGGFNAINISQYNLTTTMAVYEAVFTVGATYDNMKFGFEMGLSNDDVIIDNVVMEETGVGGPVGPNQPDGFIAENNVGGNPVGEGEVFLACGPNNVGGNIIYRLFYAPTASIPADPTTATEYPFGTTAGDADGVGPFGFVLGGLDPGVNYTFWLYQFNTLDLTFSTPAIVTQTAGGESAGTGDDDFLVTFRVDMSEYAGTFTTMELNGSFNDWCGNCAVMTNTGNDIWEITVELPAGPIEYKFSYDNWDGQEILTEGMSCTVTDFGFTNRFFNVTGDTTLPTVCFQSCQACGEAPAVRNVTFSVDMSEYGGDYTTPEVNGTFNNWCGNCAPMTNVGGDIWELTIALTDGEYQYKFSYDNWDGQEQLTPGSPCTVTLDGFTNRTLSVTADATLPTVCWASCAACLSSVEDNQLSSLTIFPNPSNGIVNIQGAIEPTNYTILVMDLNGRVVFETSNAASGQMNETIELSNLDAGMYSMQIITSTGSRMEKILIGK